MKRLILMMILLVGSISMFAIGDSLSIYNTPIESVSKAMNVDVNDTFDSVVKVQIQKEWVDVITLVGVTILFLLGWLINTGVCRKRGYDGLFDGVGNDCFIGILGIVSFVFFAVLALVILLTIPDSIYNINHMNEIVLKDMVLNIPK